MYPDLVQVVHAALAADKREPSGMLHCSSHAWKPLRFTQLESVLGVVEEEDFGSLIAMQTGTLYHHWLENFLDHDKSVLGPDWELVDSEIDLTDDLPTGWTGTADYVFVHKPTGKIVVGDLKTINPDSVAYLGDQPKKEHVTQVSCYWAACQARFTRMDPTFELDPDIFILYLPKGKTKAFKTVEPVILTAPAIPAREVVINLNSISARVQMYVEEYERTGELVNSMLAPMPGPELKCYWDSKQYIWNVTSRASWYEDYMTGGLPEWTVPRTPTKKVGHWTLDGRYVQKYDAGVEYDEIPRPSKDEVEKRRG